MASPAHASPTWSEIQTWPEDGLRYELIDGVLVVEVSSPSTRDVDAGAKRDLYERFGVAEYWFVDLEHEEVRVHRLGQAPGGYDRPQRLGRGEVLQCLRAPGFALPVARVLDA